jgi:hypothetical protein
LQPQGLQAASEASGADNVKSIEFSGTGRWYQFGQAPNPDSSWPPFDLKNFTADINYDTVSTRVQITRSQTVEPGRLRPAPVEQKVDQYVSGGTAWNVAAAGNAAPAPSAQPAAVEERLAEIWASPQGFLKAAKANNATSQAADNGTDVSFTIGGKYRYVGTINANNQLERVQTWIDKPGARRHAGRNPLQRLQRLRRHPVPRSHRPYSGRLSGAGHQRLGSQSEPGG